MDVDDLWYRRDGSEKPRCGKGLRWRARWRDPAGKQHGKSFARKLDAERHLASVTVSKGRGAYIDERAGRITLESYAASWLAVQSGAPTTRQTVKSRLDNQILPQLGGCELRQLEPSVIAAWYAGRRREISDGYARECRNTLTSILTAAVEDRKIAANPCLARSAQPPRRGSRKVVPWPQEQILLAAQNAGQYRALVLTGAAEGLRAGELLGLAVEDVDFLRRVIHVRRQVVMVAGQLVFKLPKGEKTRDVPLAGSVGLELARHIEEHGPTPVTLPWETPDGRKRVTARVLWSRRERPWSATQFTRQVWFRSLASSKISFNPGSGEDGLHVLRHYAASSWLHGGCSIRDVADFLGHSDPGFTLRTYAHLMPSAPDRMRAAADAAIVESGHDKAQTAAT